MNDKKLKKSTTAVTNVVAQLQTPGSDWIKTEVFNRTCGDMVPHTREIKGTTRYEKLAFMVVIASWGLLTVIILGVHFGNYDLETKTSSKSPTHSSFHEVVVSGEQRE